MLGVLEQISNQVKKYVFAVSYLPRYNAILKERGCK